MEQKEPTEQEPQENKKETNTIEHYSQGEIPRVHIHCSDCNGSIDIESADFSYNNALKGALYILDERFKDRIKNTRNFKDVNIG